MPIKTTVYAVTEDRQKQTQKQKQSAYNLQYTIKMPDNSIRATTKTFTKNNLAIMHNCIKARQTQIKQNLCHAVSAFEPEKHFKHLL